jgi:hypothetical protein
MERQKSLYTVQIYKKCQDNAALSFRSVNYVFKIYVRTDQRQMRRVDHQLQNRQSARLSLPSSELTPPPPHPQASVPPFGSRGGHTRLRERGAGGGGNSDEGTDTLVLYRYSIIHLRLQPNISCILH